MGLQSALTTSLTGLQAAETVIDVTGNNIANTSTVGFKESDVLFATQFLQTQSIGSAPTGNSGGTNPRQIGLGVKVAAINPDFTQGTIQISSNPLDVAIQGDGFLILQSSQGEQRYTRNGQLQTNSQNEIVSVTGNRVLGFGIDDEFNIDTTALMPLSIPLGSQTVAQPTDTAFFTGVLAPTADEGTSGIITSEALGNGNVEYPINDSSTTDPFDIGDIQIVSAPNASGSSGLDAGGGTLADGAYEYRVVWYTDQAAAGETGESAPSVSISVTVNNASPPDVGQVDLSNLPVDNSASPIWLGRRIYRSIDGSPFTQIGPDLDLTTATFSDTGGLASGGPLDESALELGDYSYYVTFYNSGNQLESRPTAQIGAFAVSDASSRIRLDNLPVSTSGDFTHLRIYRNLSNNSSEFHLVDEIPNLTATYIDTMEDADIEGNALIDLMGAKAGTGTVLTDVVLRNGEDYSQPFVEGTLTFTGRKGGRTLGDKELQITATTTLNDLRQFMEQAYGIDKSLPGSPGGSLNATTGQLEFTSNIGIENALGVSLSSFSIIPTGSTTPQPIAFDFTETQEAEGQGTTTDFLVYDTLGIAVNVRLTTVLESKDGNSTTYRWFATSDDNEPTSAVDVDTFVASGTLVFDGLGQIVGNPVTSIAVQRNQTASQSPLVFDLDFGQVNGLDVTDAFGESNSTLNMVRQDGFPPGTLTSFIITESGLIRGVFSNGAERPLGQIRMARFTNNVGLQQLGDNLYAEGVNSGTPTVGDPGEGGIGSLTAGAVELSNTDIGQNLIELILASTQYRGGARVITTTQQLLDELLNLRR